MNRQFRFASIFVLAASAMFAFTSSAHAAEPLARRTASSAASNVVRYNNGTTVKYTSAGTRVIQPYGKHAQPMLQQRDAKGQWMKAVASKSWGVRTWASSKK